MIGLEPTTTASAPNCRIAANLGQDSLTYQIAGEGMPDPPPLVERHDLIGFAARHATQGGLGSYLQDTSLHYPPTRLWLIYRIAAHTQRAGVHVGSVTP